METLPSISKTFALLTQQERQMMQPANPILDAKALATQSQNGEVINKTMVVQVITTAVEIQTLHLKISINQIEVDIKEGVVEGLKEQIKFPLIVAEQTTQLIFVGLNMVYLLAISRGMVLLILLQLIFHWKLNKMINTQFMRLLTLMILI